MEKWRPLSKNISWPVQGGLAPSPASSYREVRCMGMEILGHLPGASGYSPVQRGRLLRTAQGRVETQRPDLQLSNDEIKEIVEELQITTKTMNRRLKFTMNEDLDRIVVKVVDAKTDTVIKELPPESLQRIQARMREAIGLLLDEKI